MSDKPIQFEQPPEMPVPEDVQGLQSFYSHIQQAHQALHEVASPFNEVEPVMRSYTKSLEYMELAVMYVDRLAFMARNPEIIAAQGDADANAPS